MMAARNEIIDIAKAIGIILMVIGHTRCPEYLRHLIYLFHMPLFFLFSGYFFSQKYLYDKRTFIKRKLKSLYLPYVKWSLFFLLIYNFCFEIDIYSERVNYFGIVFHPYSMQEYFKHALSILFTMTGHAPLLGGFWFLHSIFWGNIIFLFALRYCKRATLPLLFLLTCLFLHFKIVIPIFEVSSLDTLAALFIAIGYYTKKWQSQSDKDFSMSKWNIVFSCIALILMARFMPVSFQSVSAKKLLFFVFSGIIGTVLIVKLASVLKRHANISNFLCYIGQNTLTILALHLLCFKLVSYVICEFLGMPLWHVGEHPTMELQSGGALWIIYSLCGVAMPLLLLKLYHGLLNTIKTK